MPVIVYPTSSGRQRSEQSPASMLQHIFCGGRSWINLIRSHCRKNTTASETAMPESETGSLQEPDRMARRWLKGILFTPLLMLVHFLATVNLIFLLTTMAGQYEDLFVEHNALLPGITQWTLTLSNWMNNFWYLLILALILIDGPVLLALQVLPAKRRWLVHVWFNSVLVAVLLLTGWTMLILTMTWSHATDARAAADEEPPTERKATSLMPGPPRRHSPRPAMVRSEATLFSVSRFKNKNRPGIPGPGGRGADPRVGRPVPIRDTSASAGGPRRAGPAG